MKKILSTGAKIMDDKSKKNILHIVNHSEDNFDSTKEQIFEHTSLEAAIEHASKKLNKIIPKEQLKKNSQRFDFDYICSIAKKYFDSEFNFNVDKVVFKNLFTNNRTCSYELDDEDTPCVKIDTFHQTSVLFLLNLVLHWAKHIDEDTHWHFVVMMNYIRFVCIDSTYHDDNYLEILYNLLSNDVQILELADNCGLVATTFSICHELAHYYYDHQTENPEFELDADRLAYQIILKVIDDAKYTDKFKYYTYLAPLCFFQLENLIITVDKILFNKELSSTTHPEPNKRILQLESLYIPDLYNIDTDEGNALYAGLLDVIDIFVLKTKYYKDNGYLERFINKKMR